MSYSHSTRISIRWPPAPAYENTVTTVLTVNNYFVDLRVDTASQTVDWGIAGLRTIDEKDPRRVIFLHSINSRDTFNDGDSGIFTVLENGDELETGQMANPALPGRPVRDYEELWREVAPREGPEESSGRNKGVAWILESSSPSGQADSSSARVTMIARIGGSYVAMSQPVSSRGSEKFGDRDAFSVRHEEWMAGEGWTESFVSGPASGRLPSMIKGIPGEAQGLWRKPGSEVLLDGEAFVVRGFVEIS